jgi:hypothetical protein
MKQRRISNRIPMELPVEIQWKGPRGSQKQAVGRVGNISGNGLFIEIPIRLQRGTSVRIKLILPRGDAQAPLELLCQGRVVRWNERGKVQGVGAVIDQYELRPVVRNRRRGVRAAAKKSA